MSEIMMMGWVSFLLGLVEGKGSRSRIVRQLTEDSRGVTAIEYGLISALIALACLAAINSAGLSLNLNGTFGKVASHL